MKKYIIALSLIFIGLQSTLQAQEKSEVYEQILVEAMMDVQQSLWNAGSIDDFMKLYWQSDSLEFIGSKGITYGWQKTLDNYKKGYPDKKAMGQLKFTILENKQLSENYIYIVGKWQLTKEKPVGGHFTLLWKKINGSWLIVSDHTS